MIRKFLKPFSFLPAILMMYLIFCFSAQDGETSAELSYKVSYKLVEIGGQILDADFEPWEIENRTHDRILSAGNMRFIPVLRLWSARNLADACRRDHLCRLCLHG